MIEDSELLRRYAEERSERAFAELVKRRVGLVYSVAVRQCGGDVHLAQDVTQKVFTDLARKAAELAARPVLSGWLYRSAQFAASDTVRSERRRRAREEANALMNEISNGGRGAAGGQDAVDWEKLRPVLDEALGELGEEERDAVALRFLEEKSFAEIGRRLEVSEEAARKRVSRAVGKLQGLLATRGVTSTEAALVLVLANQAAATVPAGLAASVTSGALAGAVGALTIFMSMTKLQVGIAGAVAVEGVAGYGWQAETNAELRREIAAASVQQRAVVALQSENRQLARVAAEVEVLLRDDGELKQLAQRAAEVKVLNEAKTRVAQTQARVQERRKVLERIIRVKDDRAQMEVVRLNRQGNLLVQMYKAFSTHARDPSLPADERAKHEEAAKLKLSEIQAKQREVQEFIKKSVESLSSSPEMAELRGLPPITAQGIGVEPEPLMTVGARNRSEFRSSPAPVGAGDSTLPPTPAPSASEASETGLAPAGKFKAGP